MCVKMFLIWGLTELGLVDEAKEVVNKWMARWISVVSEHGRGRAADGRCNANTEAVMSRNTQRAWLVIALGRLEPVKPQVESQLAKAYALPYACEQRQRRSQMPLHHSISPLAIVAQSSK